MTGRDSNEISGQTLRSRHANPVTQAGFASVVRPIRLDEIWIREDDVAEIVHEEKLDDRIRQGIQAALTAAHERHGAGEMGFEYLIAYLQGEQARWVREHYGPAPPRKRRKLSPSLRRQVFERDRYRCRHCGSWENLHVDHIVALANGGTDDLDNLQTLCGTCNLRKGAK